MEGFKCLSMDLNVLGWSVTAEVTNINGEEFDHEVVSVNGNGRVMLSPDDFNCTLYSPMFEAILKARIKKALIKYHRHLGASASA